MKKIIILLLLYWGASCPMANGISYQKTDSAKVVSLLKMAREKSIKESYPVYFARQLLGVPYVASTLDVLDDEQLVVNLRQLDCTTLVENVTALTLCARRHEYSFRDYCKVLMMLRYRNGLLKEYPSRLHYFTDWIVDNTAKRLVYEIQKPNPPFSAVQTVAVFYMSTHPSAYHALTVHPEYVAPIRSAEERLTGKSYRYIPKSTILKNERCLRYIADGDIIAITTNKKGLDIAHVGIAVWHRDGLHLINASMIHHQVVEESMTLGQYLGKHPSHTGIRIVRISK